MVAIAQLGCSEIQKFGEVGIWKLNTMDIQRFEEIRRGSKRFEKVRKVRKDQKVQKIRKGPKDSKRSSTEPDIQRFKKVPQCRNGSKRSKAQKVRKGLKVSKRFEGVRNYIRKGSKLGSKLG